jgi:hypothetical protein
MSFNSENKKKNKKDVLITNFSFFVFIFHILLDHKIRQEIEK